jgi:TRAP-type mannitol/chloroaromatic compound transport system permease small subunit
MTVPPGDESGRHYAFWKRGRKMSDSMVIQPEAAKAGSVSGISLSVIRRIDRFSEATGYLILLLFIPLIMSNVIEVIMRYFLKQPTSWAAEMTVFSNGSIFMLGAAYALLKGAHIRTDVFYADFSDRKKGLIDLVTLVVFFMPAMALVFYISIDDFFYAYSISERSNIGLWQPPVWPFRGVIPLAALLLFIQGISEILKSFWAVKTGKTLIQHEKIDV